MWAAASSTMAARLALSSANDEPSGAMSWSWKQKNGTPSFSKNSNAAAILVRAAAIGSTAGSSQGRSKPPSPNTSLPGQLKECQ